MLAGMNIAILNLTFGSRDEHIEAIRMLREASKNVGTKMGRNYPLAIAARLAGRKIRTGRIADVSLPIRDKVVVEGLWVIKRKSNEHTLQCQYHVQTTKKIGLFGIPCLLQSSATK